MRRFQGRPSGLGSGRHRRCQTKGPSPTTRLSVSGLRCASPPRDAAPRARASHVAGSRRRVTAADVIRPLPLGRDARRGGALDGFDSSIGCSRSCFGWDELSTEAPASARHPRARRKQSPCAPRRCSPPAAHRAAGPSPLNARRSSAQVRRRRGAPRRFGPIASASPRRGAGQHQEPSSICPAADSNSTARREAQRSSTAHQQQLAGDQYTTDVAEEDRHNPPDRRRRSRDVDAAAELFEDHQPDFAHRVAERLRITGATLRSGGRTRRTDLICRTTSGPRSPSNSSLNAASC